MWSRDHVALPFFSPGAPKDTLAMHLEVVARLPQGSWAWLDSGAIMIGSANSPLASGDTSIPQPAPVRARRYTSNYGSRVNCFAWGDHVYTCSDPATAYTSIFSGTSAASAIVAGATLSVQGMVENTLGWRLGSRQMRNVLSNPAYSTPSANPAAMASASCPI